MMRRKGGRGFYGEIEILVLKTLSHGNPMHGLAIIDAVRETSGEHLHIEDAALYPALHRLDRKGLLKGEWRMQLPKEATEIYIVLMTKDEVVNFLRPEDGKFRSLLTGKTYSKIRKACQGCARIFFTPTDAP